MFKKLKGLFSKKQKKTDKDNAQAVVDSKEETAQEEEKTDFSYALVPIDKKTEKTKNKKVKEDKKDEKDTQGTDSEKKATDFDALYELARLLNVPAEKVKDECCMYQVKNLMSKLGMVMVQTNVQEQDFAKTLFNINELKINELFVSPIYLNACAKQTKKLSLGSLYVASLIDFPLGESSVKSKLFEVKNAKTIGADGVSVVFSTVNLQDKNRKIFKRTAKKIAKLYKGQSTVAFNASVLTTEEMKFIIKTVEKTKLNGIVFMFGETTEEVLAEKFADIKKYRGKKAIKILGNIQSVEGAMKLSALGVDEILTPYAEEIGKELIKRFSIKSLKLR